MAPLAKTRRRPNVFRIVLFCAVSFRFVSFRFVLHVRLVLYPCFLLFFLSLLPHSLAFGSNHRACRFGVGGVFLTSAGPHHDRGACSGILTNTAEGPGSKYRRDGAVVRSQRSVYARAHGRHRPPGLDTAALALAGWAGLGSTQVDDIKT
jgi:hypothetical protein